MRRRRLGVQTTIARSLKGNERGDLPIETKDTAVYHGLALEHRSVVDQVARGKVVAPVYDDVESVEDPVDVFAGQSFLKLYDLYVGIECSNGFGSTINFGLT